MCYSLLTFSLFLAPMNTQPIFDKSNVLQSYPMQDGIVCMQNYIRTKGRLGFFAMTDFYS